MELTIRQEHIEDRAQVEQLIQKAFLRAEHTDGNEHHLVHILRFSASFVPELSLVALLEGKIVGHILFTKLGINTGSGNFPNSLAIASIAVSPDYQNRGIGGMMIDEGHRVARDLGFHSVILSDPTGYSPRFGYKQASYWGIKAPFDIPDEAFLAYELTPAALKGASGYVEYPPEFGI
ncbi:N-acetyltransferase [Bdellovibrio sp. SKB1291214]|uniref:GNAT family N-acetyltransferase n=1 Tax=Bdellovibrio sp. SKB1291214 TaxID=1732569 RepID=UPI000B5165F5|nr:N-acetyltransferase [Bdellovibrio sp. SKB1291214]UYL07869.1 N-acetyltransferase [Bdellovibrio sp. SKB1291214]